LLKLKRDVGLFGSTAYVLGVIVGAGIYVIIGKAGGYAGNSLWLAFLIAAFIAACTGLSYAELSSSFPRDSAEYLYTERAFKDRRFAFGIAWLKLVTHVIGTAAVALGFGGYLALLTGWNFVLCALLLLLFLTLVNFIGVKQALWFDIAMVIVAVAGLLFIIGVGAPSIQNVDFYLESPSGFPGILTGAALIFFAFLGFEIIGNLGEEVKKPKKTLPLAIIISVIISTVLYILVAIIAVSVVPWSQLAGSTSPLADVATALIGSKAGWIMAIMALAATGSTVLGLLISTSRMVYGMAEEHSFPRIFLKLTRKRRVPYLAILLVSITAALFVLPGDITAVAFLTNFGALFIFLVVNLCLIVLRYSHSHIPRGFRVPLNIGKFPVIPAIGLLTCAALLFSFSKKMFFLGILLFLSGLLIYSIFGERKHKQRVEEIVKKHLTMRKQEAGPKKKNIKKKAKPAKNRKKAVKKK
jgi:APA family basic amino acid/polyamine antiporter